MRSFRHCFFLIAVFLLQAACLQAAHAQTSDYIVARAWVDDPDANLTIDLVRQRPARAYDGVLGRGYTRSATWLKLTVAPVAARARFPLIEFEPGRLMVPPTEIPRFAAEM